MAINKNFVVKNGLEVKSNLIFADGDTNKVGIGTTIVNYTLDVLGGIGVTDVVVSSALTATTADIGTLTVNGIGITNLSVSGLSTFTGAIDANGDLDVDGHTELDNLNVSGVSTFVGVGTFQGDLYVGGDLYVADDVFYDEVNGRNLSISGFGTITDLNTTYVNVSGFGTITDLNSTNTNISGVGTINTLDVSVGAVDYSTSVNLDVTGIGSITTLDVSVGTIDYGTLVNLDVTGIGSIASLDVPTGTIDYLTSVNIESTGITTLASSGGITTTGGDLYAGQDLYFSGNLYQNGEIFTSGIGIQTGDTLIGSGVTFIEFRGPGVSTGYYDASVGIATVFFQGGGSGGGGGAIGIGSTFPGTPASTDPSPSNGDLFFHIDYGRTFIYYDEVTLGVGSSAFWVDSSPFNVGVITSLSGGVAFSDGSASSPSWYFDGDSTTGVFSPVNGELTFVSTGSSVLNINPFGINVTGVSTATSFIGNLTGNVNSSGVSTLSNVVIGGGTTELIVNGDARVTGILTIGTSSITLDGINNLINVGSGATINGNGGDLAVSGIITAASFVGDGSGLTGAGSTVADDTATDATFYPLFTTITSGTVTATKVSTTKLTFNPSTGTLSATDLNSSSDSTLKENVETVEDALNKVNNLHGVKFNWKEDGRPSYGVIAQELEQVLPELVTNTDPKSVNYNGIIAVLIEAVKELTQRVEELENKS